MRFPSKQIGNKKVVKFAAPLLFVRSTRYVSFVSHVTQSLHRIFMLLTQE
jgi:hypothetical protein